MYHCLAKGKLLHASMPKGVAISYMQDYHWKIHHRERCYTSCPIWTETIDKEKAMDDKELYKQKKRAQLDQWKAELDKLKAEAAEASADRKMELNKEVEHLEGKVEEGKSKLAEIEDASEDAWTSIKEGVDSAWDSMKHAFSDAASKFKK